MRVSIIIPVYNEEATVAELISRVQAVPIDKEIVIVDDGSTDRTRAILRGIEGAPGLLVHFAPVNAGKGAAVRKGIELARGDILLVQDADLELDPSCIPSLVAPIESNQTDVVYGSRFSGGRNRSFSLSYLANRFLVVATNVLYASRISDMETCYKVFRGSLIRGIRLECRGFEFEPEVTAKLLRLGKNIIEVPVDYTPRTEEQGKKIRWTDGLKALWTLIRYRFKAPGEFFGPGSKPAP